METWHNKLVEVQSLLPGFKGASPANHPKHAEKAALLTVADLHDALWEYVLTIYHQQPQEGDGDRVDPSRSSSRPLFPCMDHPRSSSPVADP